MCGCPRRTTVVTHSDVELMTIHRLVSKSDGVTGHHLVTKNFICALFVPFIVTLF